MDIFNLICNLLNTYTIEKRYIICKDNKQMPIRIITYDY